VGKRAALKKFMDSQKLKELGDVFMKIFQMEDIIKSAGIILSLLINQPNFWFTDPYLSLIVYP
jgi:divalent metal cation (Fe/Co/Zn/Cd) transporter